MGRAKRALRHYRLLAERALLRPLVERRLSRTEFRVEDALIISGMARGGTTWLFEILSELPGVVPNWEPLNGPNAGKLERDIAVADLLTLRDRSGWQTDYIRPRHLRRPERVLTKFVRAGSLLPVWLQQQTFVHRPIVLLRHPIATADAYVRAWGQLEKFRSWRLLPEPVYGPLFHEHEAELRGYDTEMEFRTAVWCLHHRWLLDGPELVARVRILRYEDLVRDPVSALLPVIREVAPAVDAGGFLQKVDFRRPSSSDFRADFLADPERQLRKYADAHPPEVLDRCRAIMARFGSPHY